MIPADLVGCQCGIPPAVQIRLLLRPSNLDVRIDAYPNTGQPISTIPKCKVVLTKLELHCPIAEMNPLSFKKFEEKLVHTAVKLSFRRYVVNALGIAWQTTNFSTPPMFQGGPFPARVFIGFQSTKIFNGNQQSSFMIFQRRWPKVIVQETNSSVYIGKSNF